MTAAGLALAAAVVLAVSSAFTKRLVGEFAHRQLIGPLLLLNGLLVVPFAALAHWRLTWPILLLHGLSAATLVAGSFCVFELFSEGSTAAVAIAQAMAPMPALAFSLILLSSSVTAMQAFGAVAVTVGVLAALGPAFGAFSRRRALALVALAAATSGLLVVLTKLLADRGVGIGEIYVARTTLAGLAACLLVRPRDIPVRSLPHLTLRSALQTGYYVLLIAAVERGSPTTVQTLAATTPLLLLAAGVVMRRQRPSGRIAFAALAVVAGVALVVS